MSLRYLLLVSDGHRIGDGLVQRVKQSSELGIEYEHNRFVLFANVSSDVLISPDGNSIVVGKLFHRHGNPAQVRQLENGDSSLVLKTEGRHLIERFWGSYVAAVSAAGKCHVLRDPSGGAPCYYGRGGHLTAFASEAALLVDTGFVSPSVDWEVVGRALFRPHLPLGQTAVSGIFQLLAGCAITIPSAPTEILNYWNPWDHIHPQKGSAGNAERLKRIVQATHSAWASCYKNPVVGLSGGLDSSIVAVSLAQHSRAVSCLTLTTDDPVGDERAYAQDVCRLIDAQLIETPYRDDVVELGISAARDLPIPNGMLHELSYNYAVRDAVERLNADAFFAGLGGDNVFYLTHSARPILDRIQVEGWSRHIFATANDICAITGASVWEVWRAAVRQSRHRKQKFDWPTVRECLSEEFLSEEARNPAVHPWLPPDDTSPVGKVGHVVLLLRALNHIEHRDKLLSVPMICPLLSQPVVELCLSIPTWESCAGGIDRAVARNAFSAVLPASIARRQGKGGPEGFVAQFIERYRLQIAERLLDGALADQRLLNRLHLEKILLSDQKLSPVDRPRIMTLLDTEAWVNHWSARGSILANSVSAFDHL